MTPAVPAPLDAGSLAHLTLSLGLIVALIFAIGWLVKRFKIAGPRASRCMEVIDELVIGPRERVLLVRVGEAHMLLGVGGVVSLTPLGAPLALPAAQDTQSFAARMREYLGGGAAR